MKKITFSEAYVHETAYPSVFQDGYNTAVDAANKYIELLEHTASEIQTRVIPQKDAEIEALTNERDDWQNTALRFEAMLKVKEQSEPLQPEHTINDIVKRIEKLESTMKQAVMDGDMITLNLDTDEGRRITKIK